MKILDLGCGTAKVDGAFGVDIVPLPGVDAVVDLSRPPYPFADNSWDVVVLNDVIEHMPDVIATMEEVYRICRPNAKVLIRVVNWNSHFAAMDPTHKHYFTENSFDFYGKREGRSYYTLARFDVIRVDHHYDRRVSRVLRSRRLMHALSRYLCNILQGLHFELRALKAEASPPSPESTTSQDGLRCVYCLEQTVRRIESQDQSAGLLRAAGPEWLVCTSNACGREYPVRQGVPVLRLAEADLRAAGGQASRRPGSPDSPRDLPPA